MKLLPTVEKLLEKIGLSKNDCHPELERDGEFRGLGLGGGAICVEEAMLLVGLIWAVRPDFVIELGTSKAASSLFLAAALKDLKNGTLLTVDTASSPHKEPAELAKEFELPLRFINSKNSLDFLNEFTPQEALRYVVFSDTDIKVRPQEVDMVLRTYPKGTVVAVHDTNDKHPFGPMNLPQKLEVYGWKDSVELFELPSPRGLTIVKRVK